MKNRAYWKFCKELREQIILSVESHIGISFPRENRAISGFSMGGVATWYAFLQALDLFYWFLPLSGDCWACGETGGGKYPEQTTIELVSAVCRQGSPDFRIYAITGSKDIAFSNLNTQIKAMGKYPAVFGDKLKYEVLEDGVLEWRCEHGIKFLIDIEDDDNGHEQEYSKQISAQEILDYVQVELLDPGLANRLGNRLLLLCDRLRLFLLDMVQFFFHFLEAL